MEKIDIGPSTIKWDILLMDSEYKVLTIPDYQRNYVRWDERVEEFWSDLTERKMVLPFLWSFILKEEEKDWTKVIDIVDWQQRTITIALILSALRNIGKEYGHEPFALRVQRYLEQDWSSWEHTWNYFLKCRSDTQAFFEKHVLHYDWDLLNDKYPKIVRSKNETLRNMQKNYKTIYEKLTKYLEWKPKIADVLSDLLNKILNYQIVVIKVHNDEEAYIAFEIVNASWVKLENIDLLKNLFIKESYDKNSTDIQDKVKERWKEMTDNVSDSNTKWNIESFLKHFWSARHWYITWKDLYVSFKKELSEIWVDELSQQLLEDAKLYNKFWSPEWNEFVEKFEYNSSIINSLIALKIFWITQVYILFLTVLRYKNEIWDKRVKKIFKLIEYFHFIYSVVWKWQANKVEKVYWNYCVEFIKALEKSKNLDESDRSERMQKVFDKMKSELIGLLNEYVPNEDFQSWFINIQLKSSNKDLIRYILSLYESAITTWAKKPDFELTNIEHIYPQDDSKQAEINALLNNIWNLALIEKDKNSRCWNKPLPEKIPIYKESIYEQIAEVVNEYENSSDEEKSRSETRTVERAKLIAKKITKYIEEKFNKM